MSVVRLLLHRRTLCFLVPTAAVAILLTFASCGQQAETGRYFSVTVPVDRDAGHEERRAVLAGGDHQYPPFEFLDENGLPDGFNVAVLRRVAAIMGLDVTIDLSVWSEARRRLEEGEIDMLAGMYRTPARDELHDFTIPHFVASYGLFIPGDSAIRGVEDLADARIIVHEGDLAHDHVLETGLGAEILAVPEWPDVIRALADGQGDAAVFGMGQGMRELRRGRYRSIRMIETPLFRKPYGMAVRKGDAELLAILNEGLSVLKDSGELDAIYQEWFGPLEPQPWWTTTAARTILFVAGLGIVLSLAGAGWVLILRRQVERKTQQLTAALLESEAAKRELERANEIKLRFLANVSHELRTPLHGVMGMADLLEKTGLDENQRSLVEMINGASGQLFRVLSDLLDISGAETGRLSVEITPFRIQEIVRWLEPTLRATAEERGLDFRFSCTVPDKMVQGDRERITQIVINLVANAVKFTDEGSVTVMLSYRDEMFRIEVHDTGIGIAQDALKTIFEPFVQIERENAEGTAGLGLGLSIVRSLVDRLGGAITTESRPGSGTSFFVSLPMAEILTAEIPTASPRDATDAAATVEHPERDDGISIPDLIVLIVEDEAINRLYLTRFLERSGTVTVSANDGLQAVEAVRKQRFDVILMDVSMPNMGGIEATLAIRRLEEENGFRRQPIIALTAHAHTEHAQRCLDAGMDGYVSKPYRENDVWTEIGRLVPLDRAIPRESHG